jgi:hypothetical protein
MRSNSGIVSHLLGFCPHNPDSDQSGYTLLAMGVPHVPLTGHAVYNLMGTLVIFFIIGTLASFHILFAIKHSTFFTPISPSTLGTTHALLSDGQ